MGIYSSTFLLYKRTVFSAALALKLVPPVAWHGEGRFCGQRRRADPSPPSCIPTSRSRAATSDVKSGFLVLCGSGGRQPPSARPCSGAPSAGFPFRPQLRRLRAGEGVASAGDGRLGHRQPRASRRATRAATSSRFSVKNSEFLKYFYYQTHSEDLTLYVLHYPPSGRSILLCFVCGHAAGPLPLP